MDVIWKDPIAAGARSDIREYRVETAPDSSAVWRVAGTVEASAGSGEYAFTVEQMAFGAHRVRVVRVGTDGAAVASEEAGVHVGVVGTHLLGAVHPNPLRTSAAFTLAVAEAQVVTAELYDVLGRRVGVILDEEVEADAAQRLRIAGHTLASGSYVLVVRGERFRDALRFTILR